MYELCEKLIYSSLAYLALVQRLSAIASEIKAINCTLVILYAKKVGPTPRCKRRELAISLTLFACAMTR